ncbi:MAG: flagellar hook-associated protein FlgK [bacterium]
MSDLLRIFNIGRKALSAHQSAMNTAGHNIANVNTKGYSRQRVNLTASRPQFTPRGIFGSGVDIESVERVRNKFIDQQLSQERPSVGQYEFLTDSLQSVEDVFNEPSEFGLNRAMEDFFNAFQDLANDPESASARVVLKNKALTLASGFNRVQRQLSDLNKQLNQELQVKVDEMNRLGSEIAELNKKIASFELGGSEASDFRDQRDLLIDQLAKLINIKTNENEAGVLSVTAGSRFLVVDTRVQKFALQTSSEDSTGPQVVSESGGQVVDIASGSLKGLLQARDEYIPDYLSRLDLLAQIVASEVNTRHRSGYNLAGETNVNFFNDGITGAADFAVTEEISNRPELIATASEPNKPGDNSTALAIAGLQNDSLMQDGTASLSDFYNGLLTDVGSQKQEASKFKENFSLFVEKLEANRESISGVSLDEEMTNLITSQHAFTAAARFIATVDEMTQTILDML